MGGSPVDLNRRGVNLAMLTVGSMRREENARVRVRFLGDFSLVNCGRPTAAWKPGKARTLFAYLLTNRNKVVAKEKLHNVIWPTIPYDPAASGLKVTVHGVRRELNERVGDVEGAFELLYQSYGYVLRTNNVIWVDVDEFETLANQARIAKGSRDMSAAARFCERAATIYRGDFLAGETGEWSMEQREWLRSLALRVLRTLTTDAMLHGDAASAVRYCRRTLDIDPCNEGTYQTLMLVHAQRGELGQVKRWHELCVQRLSEHLDIAPTEATDKLLRRALSSVLVDSSVQ